MTGSTSYQFSSLEEAVRALFDELNKTNSAVVELRARTEAQHRVLATLSHYLSINESIDRSVFNDQLGRLAESYRQISGDFDDPASQSQFAQTADDLERLRIPDFSESSTTPFTVIDGGKK
ncbi:MAG: hypothetical protein P0Y65_05850 [Candidatus Devosia phytovorans]|uniref:Uncharacterized protein n=1 Tax=Candidatus Devosia phytovorans TaxID=3121372 RepID=A0AAJ5VYG5_9HYPH|nr:hypothetical protein [Devosia sp.]WEK05779.1 MAG: hypothetical protein P0Y65_05850 [Devosia sp.]